MSDIIVSRFDPNGQWLASIIPALDIHKLRIHSVIENVSQSLKADFDLPKGIKATSMEWIASSTTNNNASIKKRKRTSAIPNIRDLSFDDLLLAIGTSIGSIVLFSPAKNSVLHILKSGHTVAVTSISQDITLSEPKDLFTCDITGQLVQWDLTKFSVVNKIKSPEQGTEIIRAVPFKDKNEDRQFILASTAAYLVNSSNFSAVIRTFSEFAHNVNIVDISNINSEFFVTASYDERNIIISSISNEEPANILVADSNIRAVSISENGQAVAALSENGEVEVFLNPFTAPKSTKPKRRASKNQKTSFADILVRIVRPGKGEPVRIKDIVFEKNYLVVVWLENGTVPVFEKVRWLEENGEPVAVKLLEVSRARLSANIKPTGANKHKGIDSAAVRGYSEAAGIVTSGQDLNEVESDDEETLADRLEAVEVDEPVIGKPTNKKTGNIFSTPGSFAVVLGQAIKTNDHKLLETCLSARDEEMIKISVQRLDSALAVKLLERLAEKMGRSPSRAGQLNIWIKWVMIVHGGYIVTVPNLVKSLSSLHAVLSERVSTLPRLLALQGRLEMLRSQVELRKEMKVQANGAYDDDEEDEENVEYVEESEYIVNGEEDMYDEDDNVSENDKEDGYLELEADDLSQDDDEPAEEGGYSDVEDDDSEEEEEPTVNSRKSA